MQLEQTAYENSCMLTASISTTPVNTGVVPYMGRRADVALDASASLLAPTPRSRGVR